MLSVFLCISICLAISLAQPHSQASSVIPFYEQMAQRHSREAEHPPHVQPGPNFHCLERKGRCQACDRVASGADQPLL